MIPNTIKIDIDDERDIYTGIELSVGDINAYGLILEFYKDGVFFDITGYNIAIYAKRAGSNIPIPDVGTVQNGKGYYIIKPSMYAYSGKTQLEIVLTDSGASYVTKVLYFTVRSGFSSLGGAVANETDFTVLSSLVAQAQAATTEALNAAAYANSLNGGVQYTIAPSNAVNKERADLVLDGANDGAAINAAFTNLVALRASDNVAVRVDFLGGDVTVQQSIVIPTNFRIYGNGARFNDTYPSETAVFYTQNGVVFVDGVHITSSPGNCFMCFGTLTLTNSICENAEYVADGGKIIAIGNRFIGIRIADFEGTDPISVIANNMHA